MGQAEPLTSAGANALPLGIWHSVYRYPSDSRHGLFESEHFVSLVRENDEYVFQALPNTSKSQLTVRLKVEGNMATGTWRESTSPEGYYKGVVYHGAMQLAIENGGRDLRGKWVGFGKSSTINVGVWEFNFVGSELPVD